MTSLQDISDALVALLPVYGYAVVGASAFVGATGVPLPVSLLLLAAGALTAEGVLGYVPTVLAALAAAVVGDCVAYALGGWAGRPLLERAGPRLRFSGDWLAAAERSFSRWGGGAVWLSRWLVTAAGPPVSLFAGADAYPFRLFVLFTFAGEALWSAGYVGLGWLFGDNWDTLIDLVDSLTWFGAAAIAAAVLAAAAWRLSRR